MTGEAVRVGDPADDEFLARKAAGLKIAAANRVNAGVASWLDIPRLDELDPEDAARVAKALDGA